MEKVHDRYEGYYKYFILLSFWNPVSLYEVERKVEDQYVLTVWVSSDTGSRLNPVIRDQIYFRKVDVPRIE